MTRYLPGTLALDTFKDAPCGPFMSLLYEGMPNTAAEMVFAHMGGSQIRDKDVAAIRWPTKDFPQFTDNKKAPHIRLSDNNMSVWIFEDFSFLITVEERMFSSPMPFAGQIDQEAFSHAIDEEYGLPWRKSASVQVIGNTLIHWRPEGIIKNTQVDSKHGSLGQNISIGPSTIRSLLCEASDLVDWRRTLGNIQVFPHHSTDSFFHPLMTLDNVGKITDKPEIPLRRALEAQLYILTSEEPSAQDTEVQIVVHCTIPDRNGKLKPPVAHLLFDGEPAPDDIRARFDPVFERLCTNEKYVPDYLAACSYKVGRTGRGKYTPEGPLAAIEPRNLMVISPLKELSAHERIELISIAKEA